MPQLAWEIWVFAVAVAAFAGFVKGVVGFAMPMIMISGLATLIAPEIALAMLMLPTLATNLWQAGRQGFGAAISAVKKHWRYLAVLLVMIAFSAQLIFVLPEAVMFLTLGIPVTLFAALQLVGFQLRFPPTAHRKVEVVVALFSGFVGGLAGVWGPPTVMYLTALNTEKLEQVRVQGVIYGTGAVMLMLSHIKSGLVTVGTAQASALLLVPAIVGMAIGFRIQDKLDQALFRKMTLFVLVVAGLNLVRRGIFG
ncbi:MAG: sulfite exporter TauE/SafE family protein [Pseudomonadota bacterium]